MIGGGALRTDFSSVGLPPDRSICTYICMYIYICTYVNIYICRYTCLHTYAIYKHVGIPICTNIHIYIIDFSFVGLPLDKRSTNIYKYT
jgi:hypothetical protein